MEKPARSSSLDRTPLPKPVPWDKPCDHSKGFLIHVHGDRADFIRARDYILELARGNKGPFSMEFAPLSVSSQPGSAADPFTCLLLVRGLEAFEPVSDCLSKPEIFGVYSPCRPRVYVEWGYAIAKPFDLEAFWNERGSLLLLRADVSLSLVIPAPAFLPLFATHDVNLGEAVVASSDVTSPSKSDPFSLQLRLSPRLRDMAQEAETDVSLRNRIERLQLRLERREKERGEQGGPSLLLIYEEGSQYNSMEELRRFITRFPISHLNRFIYGRFKVTLAGECRTWHVVAPKRSLGKAAGLLGTLARADRTFYLDSVWRRLTGYNVYLPLIHGRRFVFDPPIFPDTFPEGIEIQGQANKMIAALLRNAPPMKPNTEDAVVFAVDPETDRPVRICFQEKDFRDLDRACQDLNVAEMQEALSQALAGEAVHGVTSVLKSALEGASPSFEGIAERLNDEIEKAWESKKGEIDSLLEKVGKALAQADSVREQQRRIRQTYEEIDKVRQNNLASWDAFLSTVSLQHARIAEASKGELENAKKAMRNLLSDETIGEIREELNKIEGQVLDPVGLKDFPEMARTLRRIADELDRSAKRIHPRRRRSPDAP